MSKQRNLNRIIVEGRLTRDPELSTLPSGTSVCDLRIAVNRGEDKDNNDLGAYYFDVKVWNGQGEACASYLEKGRSVIVEGKLAYREFEKKDGSGKDSRTFIVADPFGVHFGSKPQARAAADETAEAEAAELVGAGAEQTDDIPF